MSLPRVSIGRPFHNVQAYVLDEHLRPLPVGLPGELYPYNDNTIQYNSTSCKTPSDERCNTATELTPVTANARSCTGSHSVNKGFCCPQPDVGTTLASP